MRYEGAASVDVGLNRITGLQSGGAGTDGTNMNQLVEKAPYSYIDSMSWKHQVRCASTTNIPTMSGLLTIDGIVLQDFNRVLVKDQVNGAENGIWWAHPGAWERPPDANTATLMEAVALEIIEGTQARQIWRLTTPTPIVLGTTALTFERWPTTGGGGGATAAALSADVNNWTIPGFDTAGTVRISSTTAVSVTGLAGGAEGREVVLHNTGTNQIFLRANNTGSAAANRFAFIGDLEIQGRGAVLLRYSNGGWIQMSSMQDYPAYVYIDANPWKFSVRASADTNVASLSGLQTMDGEALIDQDRVLLLGQTAAADNGIWVVGTGGWSRPQDADTGIDLQGAIVYVRRGTARGNTAWVQTDEDANPPTFAPFPAAGGGGGGAPGGATTQVQFNNAGVFDGDATFTFDAATDQLSVPGLAVAQDLALTGVITPPTITADQNNYNPAGLATATVVRLSADSPFRAITGLAGGTGGQIKVLANPGTRVIQLRRESASSTAANRFALPADLRIEPNQAVTVIYDATLARWTSMHAVIPDPIDPGAPWELVDDFLGQSTETGEVGLLGWLFTNGSMAAVAAPANTIGVVQRVSGATANQVAELRLGAAVGTAAFRWVDFDEMFWRVALTTTGADFSVRFGLADTSNVGPTTNHGVWVARLAADTSWFGEARNAAGAVARTAALLAQDTSYHTFRIRRIDATTVGFQVDRGTEVTIAGAGSVPDDTDTVLPFLHIVPTAATARSINIDLFTARGTPMSARW